MVVGAEDVMEDRVINILLVEDDEVDVMNVKRAFKKSNISNPLYVAGNGLEALAMLQTQTATLLLFPDSDV